MRSVVKEVAVIPNTESKPSDTKFVVHAKKIIGLGQAPLGIFRPVALITLQATFHQNPPPSIRTCVGEHAECLSVGRMLPPRIATQLRIQRYAGNVRIR